MAAVGAAGATVVLAAGLVACGGDGGDEPEGPAAEVNLTGESDVRGEVLVVGSPGALGAVAPAAEAITVLNPRVYVTDDAKPTDEAVAAFCRGEAAVLVVGRALEAAEEQTCADVGVPYVDLPLAVDALTVVAHPDLGLDCASVDQLAALGLAGGATPGGAAGDAAGGPSVVVTPTPGTAAHASFAEQVYEPGTPDGSEVAEPARRWPSAPAAEVAEVVAATPGAIGWTSVPASLVAGATVVEVAPAPGEGCVAPTAAAIADGSYPLARTVHALVSVAAEEQNRATREYVDVLVEAGIPRLVRWAGYRPVGAAEAEAATSAWEAES